MEQKQARNDELQINIGITAAPAIAFMKPNESATPPSNASLPTGKDAFQISLDAAMQYDSLSRILNGFVQGKRFDISEGFINKHVIVEEAGVAGGSSGNLLIRVDFGGSFTGTVYFTGKPVYNTATKAIQVTDLAYELKSGSFLLNTAKWLFNNKIVSELNKHTVFPLNSYFETARMALDEGINKEWKKGIRGEGSISEIMLHSIQALPQHLLIQGYCSGRLVIKISEINLTP